MYKLYALGPILMVMCGVLLAQDEPHMNDQTRVLSNLGPIEAKADAGEQPERDYEVDAVHLDTRLSRATRLYRVKAPPRQTPQPRTPLTPAVAQLWAEEAAQRAAETNTEEATMLVVASTTFNGQLTRLWWWENGEFFEAWSSIDFNYLGGFTEFQVEGKRYSFLLLHSNSEVDTLPEHPAMAPTTQSYVLASENPTSGRNVPEILHKLYSIEEVRLKESFSLRHQRRLAWEAQKRAREEARLRKDAVIYYWPRKTTNYKHLTEGGE